MGTYPFDFTHFRRLAFRFQSVPGKSEKTMLFGTKDLLTRPRHRVFMPRFGNGVQRSAREVVAALRILLLLAVLGIVFTALSGLYSTLHLPALIDFNALYSMIKTGVELVAIVSTAVLILKMPYWGTGYMFGWIVGILYFWHLGWVSASDLFLYIVPSISVLAWRVYNRASYAGYGGKYYG